MKLKKNTSIHMPLEDKILSTVVWILMILLTIVILYPMIFILSSSLF